MKRFTLLHLLLTMMLFLYEEARTQQPFFEEQNFPSPASEISLVNGIAADANNCIWLTTQSGIYRYDGIRFKHYSSLNTPSLKFERMGSIQRVLRGNVLNWCISDAKGNLYTIDSSSKLHSLSHGDGSEIIFGRFSIQVRKKGKICPLPINADSIFYVFYSRSNRQFYFSLTNGRLATISSSQLLNNGKLTYPGISIGLKGEADNIFSTDNNFYFSSPEGLFRMNGNSSPNPVSLEGDIRSTNTALEYENMRFFSPAGQSSLLVWYRGNIYEVTESIQNNSISTRLLASGAVTDIPSFLYYSPVHHLLLGCFLNKGLVLYRPRQFSLLSDMTPASRISENYYYCVLPEKNGYLTINNSGLVWLGLNKSSRAIYKDKLFPFFLHRDKAGNLWCQTRGPENGIEGVIYLEAGTNRPVSVFKPGQYSIINGIYQTNDSTYYILTNRRFQRIIHTKQKTILDTLFSAHKGEDYNFLFVRDSSTMWIGHDQGLIEFNIHSKTMKSVAALENANVRTITKLSENIYLAGTYDKWIYLYKNGHWLHLSSSDKTVAPSAHAFIVDTASNSVWVSSNKGISRLPLRYLVETALSDNAEIYTEHFSGFGKDISVEFNGSSNLSAGRVSDSSAAFANANGIVTFNPLLSLSPPLPKHILIEPVYEDNSAAKKDTENHQLQFSVVIPYFGNRNNLEVLYKLTNADDKWHTLYPNAVISYNDLKPGDHDLQFRIRHYSDVKENEVFITAGSFYIPYRWYQTIWFKIGAIALILLAVISFHYFRIWYILKRKRELEELVKRKTGELQETNENLVGVINELSLSEANLKQSNFLKDEYYAVLTHDLRSPLKFLSFNIGQLLELLPELKHDALKKGLIASYQCSTDVSKLIDEFVYWIQDNEKQLKAQPVPSQIRSIVEDARKIYEFSLDGSKNAFVNDVPADLTFPTDPKLLFIILRNAVDNANKYTSGGVITVSASRQNGTLQLTVSDTGRGINEEKALLLMNLQYGDVQLSYKQRKSLGFYIMAMLTKKLGGHYTLNSPNEKGTSLSFIIPELNEEKNTA